MPETRRIGDLELGQDLAYQWREWLFERVGWLVLCLLVLAALLGLFGEGPLSSATSRDAGGRLSVEYDRFLRHHCQTTLRVTVSPGPGEELRLSLSGEYFDKVEVKSVTPEPERVEAGPERHTFVFRAAEPGHPVTVVFHLDPGHTGTLNCAVHSGGTSVNFSQFVYP